MTVRAILFAAALAVVSSQSAFAGDGVLTGVKIDRVGVVSATSAGSHVPGNMEIRIKNGFTPPSGVSCTGNGATQYITTLSVQDPDRAMLHLLELAIVNNRKVDLWITDAAANKAWLQGNPAHSRCSLIAVSIYD